MKICLVSNLYNPDIIGGAENVVASLANGLADEGHEVLVIATKQSAFVPVYQGIYQGNIKNNKLYLYMDDLRSVIFSGLRNALLTPIWYLLDLWNPYSYYHVRRTISEFEPDIINTHNIFGMSSSVWSAARSLHIPLVHTLYDYSLICSKTTCYKSAGGPCQFVCRSCSLFTRPMKRFATAATAVIAPSEHMLKVFERNSMFLNVNKYVVSNGVEESKKKCSFAPQLINFLYMGQTSEHKGILTLIRAFSKVLGKNAVLNVVGVGDSLRSAEKLAVTDDRVFFHHFADDRTKEELFSRSSVFIVPSLWQEPFGQSILEAYSRGMPVIASKTGGIPDLVEHEKTGFLVEPGNELELALTMERFMKESDLASSMSQNCLNKAKEFALRSQVLQYCEIYENTLKAGVAAN